MSTKTSRALLRAKGRRESGPFLPVPVSVLSHPNFVQLTTKAVKLLFDLCWQLRFKEGGSLNNGDLSAAWTLMQKRGWKSKETLQAAIDELLYYGFLVLTRQGGRHVCSLYAVDWWAIDECKGKLDVKPTGVPGNQWKTKREPFKGSRTTKTVPRISDLSAPNTGAPDKKCSQKAA